jgi:chromosome segregation ATPase
MDGMDVETAEAIDSLRTELRTECASIRSEIADTRRYALVLHESLRDDIRMIADAFASMTGRFDAIDKRFDAIDKRFDAIDRRFDAIDKRFDAIEMRLDTVEIELMSHGHQLRALQLKVDTLHRPH